MSATPAPDFSLPATNGNTITLSALRGRKLVIYFYPKDNTPGCTNETRDFGTLHADFAACGSDVYGVSRDSLKSHENFKAKLELPFELISDPDEQADTGVMTPARAPSSRPATAAAPLGMII